MKEHPKKISIPVTAILPTCNRHEILQRTLESLNEQNHFPQELIIVDASDDYNLIEFIVRAINLQSDVIHIKARKKGSASQRNEGMEHSNNQYIFFFDDDIIFEDGCIKELWTQIQNNDDCGGISANITNQHFNTPSLFSKIYYWILGADLTKPLPGKCIGAAITFLPEYNPNFKGCTEMDWLHTGCTLYRKSALPNPVFDNHFTGYSLMEDLALSLRVAKKWKLLNSSKARIFHDSQQSLEKTNIKRMAEMDLANRYYIMKNIQNKNGFKIFSQLLIQQFLGGLTSKEIFHLDFWKAKMKVLTQLKKI